MKKEEANLKKEIEHMKEEEELTILVKYASIATLNFLD